MVLGRNQKGLSVAVHALKMNSTATWNGKVPSAAVRAQGMTTCLGDEYVP